MEARRKLTGEEKKKVGEGGVKTQQVAHRDMVPKSGFSPTTDTLRGASNTCTSHCPLGHSAPCGDGRRTSWGTLSLKRLSKQSLWSRGSLVPPNASGTAHRRHVDGNGRRLLHRPPSADVDAWPPAQGPSPGVLPLPRCPVPCTLPGEVAAAPALE